MPSQNSKQKGKEALKPAKSREVDETVAAIRLRTQFQDPYEEWERSARKEALRAARKTLSETQTNLQASQQKMQTLAHQSQVAAHMNQVEAVQSQLQAMRLQQDKEEARLREEWKTRDKELWSRIERVIGIEEARLKSRLEEERRRKEEEELKKRLEEERKRVAEGNLQKEKEAKEEEERKVKAEEEKKQKEEEEEKLKIEEEARNLEEAARISSENQGQEKDLRNILGYRTAEEEWNNARTSLLDLKDSVMSVVKADAQLKKAWSTVRRQITPKVGQLTKDDESINRISTQLHQLMLPNPPHPPLVYTALCASLTKTIILQAETEVTAEKTAAIPLARVAFNLLTTLDGVFREVFWTKLVQRTGGWVIPGVVPSEKDVDGRKWGTLPKGLHYDEKEPAHENASKERKIIMGYRPSATAMETPPEYAKRLSGIIRVYWEIVKAQLKERDRGFVDGPGCGQRIGQGDPPEIQALVQSPYGVSRFWVWFARMAAVRPFLETGVGAEFVHTALDVMGSEAADIWGWQWVKMLELFYQGATEGLYPERSVATDDPKKKENVTLGGTSVEGRAARVRIQIEVEKIVKGEKKVVV